MLLWILQTEQGIGLDFLSYFIEFINSFCWMCFVFGIDATIGDYHFRIILEDSSLCTSLFNA